VFGVVRDESRAVLPGATVTVTSPAMPGGPVTVVSNEQGEYRLVGLTPGIYKMSVVLNGFSTDEEGDLRVAAGGTTERNVGLVLATVAETITVSGQSPLVETRRAGIAQTQTREAIEAVPLERRSATDHMLGASAEYQQAQGGVMNLVNSRGPTSSAAMAAFT